MYTKCKMCGDQAVLVLDGNYYCGRDYPLYDQARRAERIRNGIDPRTGRKSLGGPQKIICARG